MRIFIVISIVLFYTNLNAQENALSFDGVNDYVVTAADIMPTPGAVSVEFWVKSNISAGSDNVFAMENAFVCLVYSNGDVRWFFDGGSAGSIQFSAGLNDGAWHHLAATNNGVTTSVYVDGVLLGTQGEGIFNLNSLNRATGIGAQYNGSNPFNGSIDEVRIWNDVRTNQEIIDNMCDLDNPGGEANLHAYYELNQTTGTNVPDIAGGFNGTMTNMTNADWVSGIDCTGPGGVATSLELWTKANEGVNGGAPTDGAFVDSWDDQSELANDFTQIDVVGPTEIRPVYRESGYGYANFNPTLEFDGAQGGVEGDFLENFTLNLGPEGSMYGVWFYQPQNGVGSWIRPVIAAKEGFGGGTTTNLGYIFGAGRTTTNNVLVGSIPRDDQYGISWANAAALDYHYHVAEMKNSGNNEQLIDNGLVKASGNAPGFAPAGPYTTGYEIGGHKSAGGGPANLLTRWYKGYVGEIIAYENPLSSTDQRKVQSYLAIKYGITLGNNGTSLDYTSSSNVTVWDVSANPGFNWDIAGIARDINSVQDQQKSHSINKLNPTLASGLRDIVTIANGTNGSSTADFATPTQIPTDKSFFVWGHNNAPAINTVAVVNYPTDNAEIIETIFQREWKSQETGTITTVTLEFDMDNVVGTGGLTGTNDLQFLRLLVDEDGDYSVGATSISPTFYDNTTNIVYFEHDFVPSTGNNMDQFNGYYFTLGSTNASLNPLPVELTEFQGQCTEEGNELKWTTISELDCDKFEIERLSQNGEWKVIGSIQGAGNSTQELNYQFYDRVAEMELTYYRLNQIDLNGTSRHSGVIAVDSKFCGDNDFIVFPNPASEEIVIVLNHMEEMDLEIYDMFGRLVFSESMKHQFHVNVVNWESGVYNVHVGDKVKRLIVNP